MKILSLFDGMACGHIAFDKLNILIEEYYAYETDKFAIKTAIHNFPNIVECGDVFEADYSKHKDVDWLIGGSPCTFWSIAQNTQKRETKPEGFGWDLFSQYLRAIKEAKPKYFLYENNKSMSKDIKNCITENFGFDPILIDSALVSAQHRERLYWVGIRQSDGNYKKADICQPKDLGLSVKDIIGNIIPKTKKDKSPTLTSSYYEYSVYNSFSIHPLKRPGAIRKVGIFPNRKGELKNAQATRIYGIDGKSSTLSGCAGGLGGKTGLYAIPDNVYKVKNKEIYYKDGKKFPLDVEDGYYNIRMLTVEECKKLQTVPKTYDFSCVSKSQAYKMLGNGWTVDVICHLISETLKNNA
nr:MAG TPA: Cytosine specific methyltransferase [Caudoviricetes sp.]